MPHKKKDEQLKTYARFSSIAFQMIAIIGIGTFLGTKLDSIYPNKHKLYTLICSLISVVLATVYVIRRIIVSSKQDE